MRVAFDSLLLAAALAEMRGLIGQPLTAIYRTDPSETRLSFHEETILVCTDPRFFRMHQTTRSAKLLEPNRFVHALTPLIGKVLVSVTQPECDRIACLTFGDGRSLVAELIGAHSDLILLSPDHQILASQRSSRTGVYSPPGGTYCFVPSKAAKFAAEKAGLPVEELSRVPLQAEVSNAGEVYVRPAGKSQSDFEPIGRWLDADYRQRIVEEALRAAKGSLEGQLKRATGSVEHAIRMIEDAIRTGGKTGRWQMEAELLLAYGAFQSVRTEAGRVVMDVPDYDGNLVSIPIDTDGDWKSTAARLFERAKAAKGGAEHAQLRKPQLFAQLVELKSALNRVESASTLKEVDEIQTLARDRRWVSLPPVEKDGKVVAAFDGHRVKAYEAPDGTVILVGENATANDYLTMKVAHPSDLWLHIRGAPGSHVVLKTNRQPQRVRPETVRLAAWVAARHSSQKHADYVAVDIVERRYVRRPRKAAAGSMLYDRERTIFVNPSQPFHKSEKA